MRHVKSERLKKLESELSDLEQWLKLGLVPKKDIPKHREEIESIKEKILEEKERLHFLRESGELEEASGKRGPLKTSYTDMPTIPDLDMTVTGGGVGNRYEEFTEMETASHTDSGEEEKAEQTEEEQEDYSDEESYFSDTNRWKRGGILDPDADEW